jgi:deoxyribonuclease-4
LLGSLDDTLVMSKGVPSVRPCLDFAHLHARLGDGSMNTYEEWARLLETYRHAFIDTLGDQVLQELHIHLSGIEYGPKGEKEHLRVEEADLDLRALFRALRDFHCGGRILCESPVMEDDALILKQTWQEIAAAA